MDENENLELRNKPLIFKVDNDEVDVGLFVDLLDKNLESYLKSRHWGMSKMEDFRNRYNLIRRKLLNGDISGRGYDRSYTDSKNELVDDTLNREIFYYADRILGARKRNPKQKPKIEQKYDRNFFAKEFSNYFFNGNPEINLEAWEQGDYDPETKTYIITNRQKRSNAFLEHLKSLVNGDTDALRRIKSLQTAINESKDFSDVVDEAAAFGMSPTTINKLFRMKRNSEEKKEDIPLPPELKYATEEQKLWYINEVKEGRAGQASEFIENLKKKKEIAEKEAKWNETDWGTYNPEIKSQALFGFKERNEDDNEDFQDIYDNGWKTADIADYQNLSSRFVNDLLSYSGNPELEIDTSDFYNELLKGNVDFRENNRNDRLSRFFTGLGSGAGVGAGIGAAATSWSGPGTVLGAGVGAGIGAVGGGIAALSQDTEYDKADWTKKHFVNNYRALVKRGGDNIKSGKDLQLNNPNEYYMQGAWDPKNFVFYTYDYGNNAIIKHRISDSPVMLERWREEYYNKQKVDKKQEGGIFAKKTVPAEMSVTDLDNKLQSSAGDIDREQASKRELEDDFLFEDGARLVAMGADIASMVASFVPGYGTAVAGVLGVGSTASQLVADIADDSVSAGLVFKNLALNAGMTVLGMVPGGKAPKIIKNLKPWIPKIMTFINTSNVALDPEIHKSFLKVLSDNPEDNLTVEDWKNIGYGISTIAGLTRAGAAAYLKHKFKIDPKVKTTIKVLNKDGLPTDIEINLKLLTELNLAGKKGNEAALEYLNTLLAGTDKEGSKLNFNFENKGKLNKYTFGLLGNKEIEAKTTSLPGNLAKTNRQKSIIDALNADAIAKGKRFRLSTNYEIANLGKGYLQNVNSSGFGFSHTGISDVKRNIIKDLNNKRAKLRKQNEDLEVKSAEEDLKPLPTKEYLRKQKIEEEKSQRILEVESPKLLDNNKTPFEGGYVDVVIQPRVGVKNEVRKLRKLRKSYYLHLDQLLNLGVDINNNLITNPRKVNAIRRALGLKAKDKNPFKNVFQDKDLNLYYWKNGGVIKAQAGTKVFGLTVEDPDKEQPTDFYKPNSFYKINELSRLLLAGSYNDETSKNKIASLRKNHFNTTALLVPETPVMSPSDFGTDIAANQLKNSVQETVDPNSNFLQLLEINKKIGDLYVLDKIRRNLIVLELIAHKTAEKQKQAELNHSNAEENKRINALLGTEIDNTNLAKDYKNWMAVDNYLKDVSVQARQKEQAGEKAAYNLFVNQELKKMEDTLYPLTLEYKAWASDPINSGKSPLEWEKYNELIDLRNKTQRNLFNNISKYQALYFGIPFTPLILDNTQLFSLPTWYYKKGGKLNPSDKKNLEIAKMLLKDILEQVKRSEKKLERLEKLTKKAKKK